MRKLRKLVRNKSKAIKPTRIRNYRHDIKNEEVLKKIEQGWGVNKCCEKFNCSKNLILSIVNKTRPDIDAEYIKKQIPIKDLCTGCRVRRKKKGNRFLCALCFDKGDSDEDSYYYMGFGYSSFLTTDILGDEYEIQEGSREETKPMARKEQYKKHDDSSKGEGTQSDS